MTTPLLSLDTPEPRSPATFRRLWAIAAVYGLTVAAAYWLAPRQMRELPTIVLAMAVATFIVAGITALLFFSHAQASGRRGYLVLGVTFAYLAGLSLLFPFVFLGAILPDERIWGGDQSGRWLYYLWNSGVAAGVGVSAFVLAHDQRSHHRPRLGRGNVVAGVVLVVALVLSALLVTVGSSHLPVVVHSNRRLTELGVTLDKVLVGVASATTAVCLWGARSGSRIGLWLGGVAWLLLGQTVVALNTLAIYSAGFYYNRLLGLLAYAALLTALIWSLAKLDRTISSMAATDALTGIGNRAGLLSVLERELSLAQRSHTSIALLWLDLDAFKAVNDNLGHAAGDVVLSEIGKRIRGEVRGNDYVARLGGDEFGVLLCNDVNDERASSVASRIVAAISRPVGRDWSEFNVTASVGIATFPDDAGTVDDLLRHADAAMYAAKRAGGNGVLMYDLRAAPVDQERTAANNDPP